MTYKFERLEIWQLSLDYLDRIYKIANALPDTEKYNLKSQIIRAATSISLNIAEGSTGQSDAEQRRFLGMALRSAIETVACMKIIQRRKFPVDEPLLSSIEKAAKTLIIKIQAMRRALRANSDRSSEPSVFYESGDERTEDHRP